MNTFDERVRAALALIQKQKQELEVIVVQASSGQDAALIRARLQRWRDRTHKRVSTEISESEAESFREKTRGVFYTNEWSNINGDIVEFTTALNLLQEELQNHPEDILDVSGRGGRRHFDKTDRPTMFIGSSVEGLPVAGALHAALDHDVEVTVWNQGVFGLSFGGLESLLVAADKYDFAALVLTPDDVRTKRDHTGNSPRDNVLFELGLFMGALGRERTFIVYCRDESLELPTDLAGVTAATYGKRSDGKMQAALGPVATKIRMAIEDAKKI